MSDERSTDPLLVALLLLILLHVCEPEGVWAVLGWLSFGAWAVIAISETALPLGDRLMDWLERREARQ